MPETQPKPALLTVPDTSELQSKSTALSVAAQNLAVKDNNDYRAAAEFVKSCAVLEKEIKATFDPLVAQANGLHKSLTTARSKFTTPISTACALVTGRMKVYLCDVEEERRRQEQELRAKAKREAEDKRVNEAAALETQGKTEEANALLDRPIQPAPVIVSRDVPKVEGISVRSNWVYRIVDINSLPDEFTMKVPDEAKLKAHAKSHRDTVPVAGVEFFDDAVIGKRV